ncbi:MAG TPA: NAD-dependent epimerase/dehydratase family protein [Planctomycetota bacterium]
MSPSRRSFLRSAALTGGFLPGAARFVRAQEPAKRRLDLLILGGTGFLGPHVVEAALARGHNMTLFNRGRTNAEFFPDLEKLRGDRDPKVGDGLKALEGRKWDGVIDTSGYVPRIVGASARLLADHVGHYAFISSISAYTDFSAPGMTESAPLATMEDETDEDARRYYGPLKVLCEKAAEAAMPGRTTVLRPGLIVGPLDPTDRFSYWPLRIRNGGEVLAPGVPADPIQWIDARDLAVFTVRSIENSLAGIYNMVGPVFAADNAEFLYGCKAVTGGDARFTWVDAEFLAEKQIQPWGHLPVWAPGGGESAGLNTCSNAKAVAAGFTTRPLAETVGDLIAWWNEQPDERRARVRAGWTAEKEAETLAAWHAR